MISTNTIYKTTRIATYIYMTLGKTSIQFLNYINFILQVTILQTLMQIDQNWPRIPKLRDNQNLNTKSKPELLQHFTPPN